MDLAGTGYTETIRRLSNKPGGKVVYGAFSLGWPRRLSERCLPLQELFLRKCVALLGLSQSF